MSSRQPLRHAERWVLGLMVLGIAARIGFGLARGEDRLLRDGYSFYLIMATNFLDGHGICYAADGGCAARMPIYPLWLSVFLATGTLSPGLVLAQSVVGGALTWVTWDLGRQLFDRRVGVIAAAAVALNPYAVIHDTALQDTVFVNVLMVTAMALLLRARATTAGPTWMWAGGALAAAVLVNARIVLFVPLALAWAGLAVSGDRRARTRAVALVALPLVVLLGGWVARNWRLVGAPVLTTEGGEQLWYGNNPWTFSHFPVRSIDLTGGELILKMPADARERLEQFQGTEAERDAVVAGWAVDYMTADPARTARAVSRKLWVAASAQLSPARGAVVQLGYAALFLPVHLLALFSVWRSRHAWREHGLTWALLIAFAVTTAIFWAHTSHKNYLDAVLFVYAAAGAYMLAPARLRQRGES